MQSALTLARDRKVTPSPEAVETLGEGWIGSEALAISLYFAVVAVDDYARGVRLAANHSGDSDSTRSTTSNIQGALLGEGAIPSNWLEGMELAGVFDK